MSQKYPAPKVGLALSGGTTLGIAHIGALAALQERGVPIDCISGTSAGALAAAGFAFGLSPTKMMEITQGLSWRKLTRFGYSKLGFVSNQPMAVFLTDLLGDVQIENAQIPLSIVATNIETYEMVTLRTGSLHEAIRASTCLPGYFLPVEVGGQLLVDGGLSENLPLSPLGEMGATVTIGVNLAANPACLRPKNIFDVLSNSYTVLARHRDNALGEKADVLIEPDVSTFDFRKFKNIEGLFQAGYDAAVAAIPRILEVIDQQKKPKRFTLMRKIRSIFK